MNTNPSNKDGMTPLSKLSTLSDPLRDELRDRGVVSCEQLYSLLLVDSASQREKPEQLLSGDLDAQWDAIREELDRVIPESQRLKLMDTFACEQKVNRPMGVLPPEEQPELQGGTEGKRPLVRPSSKADTDVSDHVDQRNESDSDQTEQNKEPRQCD